MDPEDSARRPGAEAEAKSIDEHDWGLYPDLERFIAGEVQLFLNNNAFAKQLSESMLAKTSTNFIDWIDHIAIPKSRVGKERLLQLGLTEIEVERPKGFTVFKHLKSYLFPVLLNDGEEMVVGLKPESIDDFLQVLGKGTVPNGAPFSRIRAAEIDRQGAYMLNAVERRGYDGFVVKESKDVDAYLEVLTAFFCRRRFFNSDREGMDYTESLVADSAKKLDSARVSDAFFRAERAYWQRRNKTGQVQKGRQDTLGLGWGNHDHHTYRSSRESFTAMIRIFEKMGYRCREKYYAGEKAGWGAQILEHPVCNIVVFTDVDLSPEETSIDFSHSGLPHRQALGTVGLWVGLHGESMLQAGMHHLEARFEFDKLRSDLEGYGLKVMPPFSYFDFLKQAFTAGDFWPVESKRLDKLLAESSITQEQYDKFLKEGALGSHMENLQREQGFKGFNRSSVTKIIIATDPRAQHFEGA